MSVFPRVRYLTPTSDKWKQWISSHANSLKYILFLAHLLPGFLNYLLTSGSSTNVLHASTFLSIVLRIPSILPSFIWKYITMMENNFQFCRRQYLLTASNRAEF